MSVDRAKKAATEEAAYIADKISQVGCLHMEWGEQTQAEVESILLEHLCSHFPVEDTGLMGAAKKVIDRYEIILGWQGEIQIRDLRIELGDEINHLRAVIAKRTAPPVEREEK